MKFSVVTISFNQAQWLRECMDSVLGQEGVEVEYIVVDPGSTDGSRDIVASYGSRLAAVILEPDKGPADGLNKGFAKATGDVFFYLNSDDLVFPGAFAEAAEVFRRNPEVDVVYGDGIEIDENGRRTSIVYSLPVFSAYGFMCGGLNMLQQSTFIRAQAFRRAGGFKVTNKTCWDGELLVDLGQTGSRFLHQARLWGAFRLYGGSITGSGRLHEMRLRQREDIFRRNFGRDYDKRDLILNLAGRIGNKLSAQLRRGRYERELAAGHDKRKPPGSAG